MNKGLEEIKTLRGFNQVELNNDENINKSLDVIEKALQRLESIDNANPSEAMECLEKLELLTCDFEWYKDNIDTIKQALLKSQEQDRVLEVLFEKRIDLESFYTSFIEGNYDYNFYDIHYGTYGLECLTEEEFDLLKRYCDERYKNR